jgi:glycosyltransferase involved in cell wall biosynthesis
MDIKRSISKRFNKVFGHSKKEEVGKIIVNLYGSNYEKHVLISYIISPFQGENNFLHQNYVTSHILAESFSQLGYNVDIVNYYEDKLEIDYNKYSVIMGFGYVLERSFYIQNRDIFRINFVTGAHEDFQNAMSLKGVRDFYNLSGMWVTEEANVLTESCYYSLFDADMAIILAYGYVYEDYKARYKNELYSLNNNILGIFSDFSPKTIANRNSNFLFLSGKGQTNKGLHILLELARRRPDLNFYVVIISLHERMEKYFDEVLHSPNVFFYKQLRMDSPEMRTIIEKCTYCLAPSYVDGLPGGTIEPMSAGLVPIISKYCGLPDKDFIFELEELSVNGLDRKITEALSMTDETYLYCSNSVKAFALESFSPKQVKKQFMEILHAKLAIQN